MVCFDSSWLLLPFGFNFIKAIPDDKHSNKDIQSVQETLSSIKIDIDSNVLIADVSALISTKAFHEIFS